MYTGSITPSTYNLDHSYYWEGGLYPGFVCPMVLNLFDSNMIDPATYNPKYISLTDKQIKVNCGVPHVAVVTTTYSVKAALPGYNVYLDIFFSFEAVVACPPLQSVRIDPSAFPLLKNGVTITKKIRST